MNQTRLVGEGSEGIDDVWGTRDENFLEKHLQDQQLVTKS